MRLVTFTVGGAGQHVGVLFDEDRQVADLTKASARMNNNGGSHLKSMHALIEAGPAALDDARALLEKVESGNLDARWSRGDVTLLAPVPVPAQMRDFLCFEQHLIQAREMRYRKMAAKQPDPEKAFREFEERGVLKPLDVFRQIPVFYKPNRFNVVGTDAEIRWPSYCETLDFELEFGLFIGKSGTNIPRHEAMSHVFGYTIFNDVSARDQQAREMEAMIGPGKGKDFNTGNPMGPCLVTADEIPNPYALKMKARINGEEWTNNSSSTMTWKFEDLISWVSTDETVHAGEFFASGTVGGGCGIELDRWLQPGDVIELEVEKIGVLRNKVVRKATGSGA